MPEVTDVAEVETVVVATPSSTVVAVAVADGYPVDEIATEVAPTLAGYPPPEETVVVVPTAVATAINPTVQVTQAIYLPLVEGADEPTATTTPLPTVTPMPTATPIPTLDFTAVAADLSGQGLALSPNKIGFHIGVGGNRDGLGEWMRRLDEAGVPMFLKTVSDAGPLFEAQEMMKVSGVPHVLVFRHSGDLYDVPDYSLPPAEAARQHWARHLAVWPPELDPDYVWLETINEVDKNRSVWLAEFALETAALAERDGYKWAAFGWSSGEPEPTDWSSPQMLQFLRLAASRPERLAIALHEYSYLVENIQDGFPFKVGRFQLLFDVVDAHGIGRPTVLITEWGWAYQNIPNVEQAMADIAWAEQLYAPHPEIKGAAIWYLGPGFGDVASQTQKLIFPMMVRGLTTYQTRPLP